MDSLTNKEVVRLFFEIYNSQDYEATYKYIAPNYIDHGLPQVRRVDDAIEILKTTHKAFPDIKVVIDDLIEENDKVVFRGHFTATHLGEFVGMASTGMKVEFEALEIFKIENQKITESWGYWPLSEIVSQIQASEKF
ncbi:ester cyclase [Dolichospermum circinale CS-1225]|uniref:Ester cyclase n=1 Tax=Dolichospermum circinale CS-537/01 TaxID=3021739 RepID=A0ABT5A7K9_9CYAN|nr:ester cyclase [Dolichospermum circinale]MDB9465052.1 ester cyclase [Dolichospermum circinale CS-539/09]MDB9469664.1 ester cyclase [Dolichospermum circinale CS-539]MDB9487938.1 ester cyclase [Dolichospermum circinale CS-537/01]MDB9520422.1 ester cyclase [Dolichospermum circinale CS-1225]